MTFVPKAESGQNPLLPASYDWVLSGLVLATVVLAVVAVVVLARSRPIGTAQVFWLLVVLALPVVGPLLFFVLGARRNPDTWEVP